VADERRTAPGRERRSTDPAEYWLRESQRVGRIGSYQLDIAAGTWRGTDILYEIVGIDENDPRTVESWAAAVHPDDQEEMLRYFGEDVVGRRQPFERDYRIIRKSDGQERWVSGRGELALNENGDPISMVARRGVDRAQLFGSDGQCKPVRG